MNPNFTLSQNKKYRLYFQRDGIIQDLGNTNIAYSPNLVAANSFTYLPVKGLQLLFCQNLLVNNTWEILIRLILNWIVILLVISMLHTIGKINKGINSIVFFCFGQ